MFGESDESPRTASPWDDLVKSDPVSPATTDESACSLSRTPRLLPKLVPEVEEGNVEYKLRLLNPTAERFTRLVTQLKWRLLEGGGQAYYELGVADSGQLVGLPPDHLEQSLQTLEEMAGEIGASVIIVKEIELPVALVEATQNKNPHGKIADGAMRMNKVRVADYIEETASSPGSERILTSRDAIGAAAGDELDNDFQLSPGVQSEAMQDDDVSDMDDEIFANELEISSVYKPRPHRKRTPTPSHSPLQRPAGADETNGTFALELSSLHVPSAPVNVPASSVRKSEKWRRKQMKRSLQKQVPQIVVGNGGDAQEDGDSELPSASSLRVDTIGTIDHSKAIDELEAAASLMSLRDEATPTFIPPTSPSVATLTADSPPTSNGCNGDAPEILRKGVLVPNDPSEKRFIVEALVVRKSSIDESFLDFGGF